MLNGHRKIEKDANLTLPPRYWTRVDGSRGLSEPTRKGIEFKILLKIGRW